MAALVLRIKFPDTYPLIYKTLRVDASMTVDEAVKYIAETVNVATLLKGTEGLLDPENGWLDDSKPLSDYQSLQDIEYIEFKDKNEEISDIKKKRFRFGTRLSMCNNVTLVLISKLIVLFYLGNKFISLITYFYKHSLQCIYTFFILPLF